MHFTYLLGSEAVMKKQRTLKYTLNLGAILSLILAIYFIYYLLLKDDLLPFSIPFVLSSINHWSHHWHVLVVGLMPIYLAVVIFGAAMFGIYFGSALHRWVLRYLNSRENKSIL